MKTIPLRKIGIHEDNSVTNWERPWDRSWDRWNQWGQASSILDLESRSQGGDRVGECPVLKACVKIRDDCLVYNSFTRELYKASPTMRRLLENCDGKKSVKELRKRFGKNAVTSLLRSGLVF